LEFSQNGLAPKNIPLSPQMQLNVCIALCRHQLIVGRKIKSAEQIKQKKRAPLKLVVGMTKSLMAEW
jgi:hypothetical protein